MFEFFLLAVLIAAAWFWLDSIAKREVAVKFGRELAGRWQLQLLDESVACTQIRLGRDNRGHTQLLRFYEFEVSASGAERMQCSIQLLGKQLQSWHIPPYVQPVQSDSAESNVHRIH